MVPTTMKAIRTTALDRAEIQEVPVPKLRDDTVLVKVKAVAINPTDWRHIAVEELFHKGHISGCDLSGVVEEVGAGVKTPWKKGDRIMGWVHGLKGNDPEIGAFAEYALVKGDLFPKTPNNLTDEEAATTGVGITTVAQGLYQSLGLPLPGEGKAGYPLLVYGGSTATGTIAIQLGKLSGCDVITTCSPHNFELVKKLGASEAFDYKDPDCASKIRQYTNDGLTRAFDCISEGASPRISSEAISSRGGQVTSLLRCEYDRPDVTNDFVLAYTVFGEDFPFFGKLWPANRKSLQFGQKFWSQATKLLESGQVKVHPSEVRPGGLQGVLDGMQRLREGKVSGAKLVYRIEETS